MSVRGIETKSAGLIGEVKDFLKSLAAELPRFFSPASAPRRQTVPKPAKHVSYEGR